MTIEQINNRIITLQNEIDITEKEKSKLITNDSFNRDNLKKYEIKLSSLYKEIETLKEEKFLITVEKPMYENQEIDLYLFFNSNYYQEWLITVHQEKRKIGRVTIDYSREFSNISYVIEDEYRGNNYASKALNLLKLEMVKNGLLKLNIVIESYNKASINTALAIGCKLIKNTKEFNIYEIDLSSSSKKNK